MSCVTLPLPCFDSVPHAWIWCLEEMGHEVVVADPHFASMYATRSRRVKTDKRDARTLAEANRLGAYRPAHRISDERRQVRAQVGVLLGRPCRRPSSAPALLPATPQHPFRPSWRSGQGGASVTTGVMSAV
jgi:hypothetical protein